MKYYILAILAALSIASTAQANGYGLKLDKAVGDYIVNVDADAYTLTAGEPVRFNFQLWNKDHASAIDADNVWVRITKQGSYSSLFAGQIGKPEFGGMGMTYLFSKPGNYDISARFQKVGEKGNESLAEASFALTVEGDPENVPGQSNTRNSISWGILGLLAGATIVLFLKTLGKEMSQKVFIGSIVTIVVLAIAVWLVLWLSGRPKITPPTQSGPSTSNKYSPNLISQPPIPPPPALSR